MQVNDRGEGGYQFKVSADPETSTFQFGADIQADGSEQSLISDAVSLRPKKKKKKKTKTNASPDVEEIAQNNIIDLIGDSIIEANKEQEKDEGEFEFTMIGDDKPTMPIKKAPQEPEDEI